jgi:N-acetylmuramoyl-L-alanine amidase
MRAWIAIAAAAAAAWTAGVTPRASGDPASVAGRIVFLDPGHNGANDASITRQVPTGRGGTKDCQTTGTSTDRGYAEHTFTWDTTLRIRAALTALGVRSALSRGDDTSVGPCVDQRAAAANALHPDAIVSIHADGGPASGHGFHVNYSAPSLNAAQSGPALTLANDIRDRLQAAGYTPADYIGNNGLYGRADLAGLNLAQYPAVLVELGNMKNPGEASTMQTPEGRQHYADAVVAGIVTYLQQQPATTN